MPRDSSGNYTLPAGNPVFTDTTITSDWANTTMSDLGNEMTDSLSRTGQGGMLAPLPFTDGDAIQPSMTFILEPTLGFYRAGPGTLGLAGLGVTAFVFSTASGNIGVAGLAPVTESELTRKDYVDNLALSSSLASIMAGLSNVLWDDLLTGIQYFCVSIATAEVSAASNLLLRIGDTDTPETSVYTSRPANIANGVFPVVLAPDSTGIPIAAVDLAADDVIEGVFEGYRVGDSNNWIINSSFVNLSSSIEYRNSGIKTLTGDIQSIELVLTAGTFDGGTVGLVIQRNSGASLNPPVI